MPHDGNFNDFSVNLKDFLQRSFSRLPGKATNKELDRSRERERGRERERRGEERRETKKDKGGQYTPFLLTRAFAHAAKKKQKR